MCVNGVGIGMGRITMDASPVKKPKGPSSGSFRVNRGGSWQANDLSHLETTYRNYGGAGVAFTNFGFRIVKGNC